MRTHISNDETLDKVKAETLTLSGIGTNVSPDHGGEVEPLPGQLDANSENCLVSHVTIMVHATQCNCCENGFLNLFSRSKCQSLTE